MNTRIVPWVIFLGFLSLLVFSASPVAQTIDWLLWPVRFGLIAGMSAILLWSRWRHRNDNKDTNHTAGKDSADHFLASVRRWYYGDPPAKN
jgi:ABC-type nickel/cobalt efflux system permease component RcnA